ncbi:zinc-binding dehydrogenase [Sphingomonas sp. NBWT7]|uniref:zinc-binding dehydrogenase n=1 Tax=Sphingomonas sp. NBWT7 TaxID=2596913 RepID=UPI00162463C9|nr:zinc-binding dehydrogenase [Sphingomonas sp. NBWT7]QNE32510.1 zinc-binding dehydrogenase [Sphingomonas sp. NBWT7]
MALEGRELRSKIDVNGTLTLSLEFAKIDAPGDDEVVIHIEAAPINPSDLGLLLGPADLSTMRILEGRNGISFTVPEDKLSAVKGRIGQSLPVGVEGAGTVVAAGRNAKALDGRLVGVASGGTFADYRKVSARDVVPLPAGVTAAAGASMFVNPLTALSFVETARRERHKAIIHTAAASNLGQMLQKVCLADDIPLVNIVRSAEQVEILKNIGAVHILNSRDPDFINQLQDAVEATGATVAFDAIGGGSMATQILEAMEAVATRSMVDYSRYGSDEMKRLYIYGVLDHSLVVLNSRRFGFEWSVSGWLLLPFLARAGKEVAERLRQRVADELTTTFASHYSHVIGLAQALEPDVLRAYEKKATGEKFLIDPSRG